jgi:hypothetical protein
MDSSSSNGLPAHISQQLESVFRQLLGGGHEDVPISVTFVHGISGDEEENNSPSESDEQESTPRGQRGERDTASFVSGGQIPFVSHMGGTASSPNALGAVTTSA